MICLGIVLCLFCLRPIELLGSRDLEISSNLEIFQPLSFYVPVPSFLCGTPITYVRPFMIPWVHWGSRTIFRTFFPSLCFSLNSFYCCVFKFYGLFFWWVGRVGGSSSAVILIQLTFHFCYCFCFRSSIGSFYIFHLSLHYIHIFI